MKDPETMQAIAICLDRGVSLREIERRFFVAPSTVSRWGKEGKIPPVPKEMEHAGTVEQQNGTPETAPEQPVVKQAEIAIASPETGVPPVPKRSKWQRFAAFIARHFGLMDLAYYGLNGTACFAMWDTAPGVVGGSFAFVYALFSLDAILRVKRADMPIAADAAANRVVVMEVIASIAHFRLISSYLWTNLEKMPFRVFETAGKEYRVMDGSHCVNCYFENGWAVDAIAVACAVLMAVAACHAVFFAKAAAKERK